MNLEVLVQGVPLGEAAVTLLTLIGPGARVDVGVVPQVLLGREALPTRLAHEGLLSCGEEEDDGGGDIGFLPHTKGMHARRAMARTQKRMGCNWA